MFLKIGKFSKPTNFLKNFKNCGNFKIAKFSKIGYRIKNFAVQESYDKYFIFLEKLERATEMQCVHMNNKRLSIFIGKNFRHNINGIIS